MPLHELIFLKECDCMLEVSMEFICEYMDYYISKEGTYLRMYGGSQATTLFPRYATDYVVHEESVRQLFIDGVGNFLFDMKKKDFPPLPFCTGSYKFTRVKSALEFVKDL